MSHKSDRRGSNPRSRPWQGRALPTTPLSHLSCYFQALCSTTKYIILQDKMFVKHFFKKFLNFFTGKIRYLIIKKRCAMIEKLKPVKGDDSICERNWQPCFYAPHFFFRLLYLRRLRDMKIPLTFISRTTKRPIPFR